MASRSRTPDRGIPAPPRHPADPPPVPERPVLDPRQRLEILGAEGVLLLSERGPRWLDGEIYPSLLPLLDGRRTPGDLVEALRGVASPAEVFATLVALGRAGLLSVSENSENRPPLCEATENPSENRSLPSDSRPGEIADPGSRAGLLESFQRPSENRPPLFEGFQRRGALRMLVVASDELLQGVAEELLGRWSLSATATGADLGLALVDDYRAPVVGEWERRFARSGIPWLLVRPRGEMPWIGPFFGTRDHGGGAPCWGCLTGRLTPNLAIERHLEAFAAGAAQRSGATVPLPADRESIAGVLGWALEELVASGGARFEERLLRLDLSSGELETHPVAVLPGCTGCSPAGGRGNGPRALVLAPGIRSEAMDGGYRVRPLAETLATLESAVSPLIGVVRSPVRRSTAGGEVVQVFTAAYAAPGRYGSWSSLRRRLRARSAGKGRSEAQARVSALAEAVERYSGVFQGNEPRRRASHEELGDEAVHPNACMLFSRSQYRERGRWNAEQGHSNWVPRPLDPRRAIEWSPVWSLGEERFKLLPTAYGFYDYRDAEQDPSAQAEDETACLADSNGCAAGNTVEEAILQGLLELIERDAAALWWYSRARRPGIDLGAFEDPYFDRLPAVFGALSRELWVLDLTSDFGIPVAVAVSRTLERRPDDLMMGFGAHLDPAIAVSRALTELCQFLPPGAETAGVAEAVASPRWQALATGGEPEWLEASQVPAPSELARRPPLTSGDLAGDLRSLVDRVRASGLDVLVLDQSRPEAPLPVVKVVVPGLRPWWARFAPGRLYDVPPALGWLEEPLDEERLNPTHLFL